MKSFFKYFIILFFSSASTVCLSSMTAISANAMQRPEVMLEQVTEDMLTALKREDVAIKKNPDRLIAIVEKVLVPHVDINDMSRWVVGRNAWLKATPAQQAQFASEFKLLLIRTYASTLTAYTNQTIQYLPVRDDLASKSRVQVASLIKEPGRAPIHVSYRLTSTGSDWKVYDINIEGVSLLVGFRAQFEPDIQQFGIGSVINKMRTHNTKPLS